MATAELSRELEESLKHQEHAHIIDSTQQDREWWTIPGNRFATQEDGIKALQLGTLTPVTFPNKYFGLSSDIRQNPLLQSLRPEALACLNYTLQELDKRTNFSSRNYRLIMTSFYRSDELQEEIMNGPNWYRAAIPGTSAHAAGAAFDFNIPTHYCVNPEGTLVGTWKAEAQELYEAELFEQLMCILSELAEEGICNVLVENEVKDCELTPICIHVCVCPDSALLLGSKLEE